MTATLLDSSVLIAATVVEHVHHDVANEWLETAGTVAVCPVVEGALLRYLIRSGESAGAGAAILRAIRAVERLQFWPDDVSYADADLAMVRGHAQVTDAYLVALARAHDAELVTLDHALAEAHSHGVRLITS